LAQKLDEAELVDQDASPDANDRRLQAREIGVAGVGAMDPCPHPALKARMPFFYLPDRQRDDLCFAQRRATYFSSNHLTPFVTWRRE